jgi:hypothetical protein
MHKNAAVIRIVVNWKYCPLGLGVLVSILFNFDVLLSVAFGFSPAFFTPVCVSRIICGLK